MLIKKEDSEAHQNSASCRVFEHNHFTGKMSYATAEIDGFYPSEFKKAKNLKCETIFIGISGMGIVHSERGKFIIRAGDTCHIPAMENYSIQGKSLVLGVANSPKWTPEQYVEV